MTRRLCESVFLITYFGKKTKNHSIPNKYVPVGLYTNFFLFFLSPIEKANLNLRKLFTPMEVGDFNI